MFIGRMAAIVYSKRKREINGGWRRRRPSEEEIDQLKNEDRN